MANSQTFQKCLALCALTLGTGLLAQMNPDPSIFDASQNGAGSGGSPISVNGTPLGGRISVVNESQLPPIDIQTNIPGLGGNGLNLPGVLGQVASQGIQSSGGGGMPPLMGGSSGGMGSGGQSSPFPMPSSQGQQSQGSQSQQTPPMMPQSQQSQGQGQQGSQGQMPQGQQSQQQNSQNQQGSQGQMPQGQQQQSQSQSGSQGQSQQGQQSQSQSGSQAPLSSKMPPPPPTHSIGDESAQIDPNGELSSEDAEGGDEGVAGEAGESAEQKRKSRSGNSNQSGQEQEQSEGDGQAMPEDIGGSQNNKRGKGTIDDVAVPSNL